MELCDFEIEIGNDGLTCEPEYAAFMCWPETETGVILELSCSRFSSSIYQNRYCGLNGKWEELSEKFKENFIQR